jgi:hypothetical protein
MQKMIGIGIVVAVVWVGVTVYTEGIDNAFGGALAGFASKSAGDATSTLKRIQRSASNARDRQLERVERQLGEGSVGLRDD